MAFSDEQQQALKAKLRYRHVRTRASNGNSISYVEGWHVIAEANRIFGYDSWDRQTLSPRCLWREAQRGETTCFYAAKVRITVRAGEAIIVREGVGTGFGKSRTAETAHEIALKAAETDATKRALATFGNPFGLALYDKELRGVTRRPRRDAAAAASEASSANGRVRFAPYRRSHGTFHQRRSVRRGNRASRARVDDRRSGLRVLGSKPRQLCSLAASRKRRRRPILSQRLDRR